VRYNAGVNVGILKIRLRLPENSSLKGKRQVLKSIIAQLRNHFNVSVAEVEDNDLWRSAVIGVACLSNDPRFTNEVLSKAVNLVEKGRFEMEMADYEIEIINL
jgi:hypothetical protein